MAKKRTGGTTTRRSAKKRARSSGGCLGRLVLLAVLVALIGGGYWFYQRGEIDFEEVAQKIKGAVTSAEEPNVTLYFAHPQWTKLIGEKRTVKPEADVVEQVGKLVRLLIAGPNSDNAEPVLPEGTEIRKIYMGPGGLLMIDFEPTLDELRSYGAGGELLSVFALIHTICENVEEVNSVQILVGGEVRATLAGHVRITEPLKPRPDLIDTQIAQ
jgi:hypothetical protein